MSPVDSDLIVQVEQAASTAYAPYSNFKVGCVLIASDGQIFTGCNVENASYGLCICAERTAAVKAVSLDAKRFSSAYVYANTSDFCWPCGACRQFLNEFGPNMDIIAVNCRKEIMKTTLDKLLPMSFGAQTMKTKQ